MNDNLISRAQEHLKKRDFKKAATCFEEAAAAADDKRKGADLLKKSAQAYDECRDTQNLFRCYREASQLLERSARAECLLECWKAYISAIAGSEWECCFEFRGDDSHSDDHDITQAHIAKLQTGAEEVLKEALNVEGANPHRILNLAKEECERRKKKDGWGADRGFRIIANVTQ
jgi:tetratricopeptide (TPR) repeat protein